MASVSAWSRWKGVAQVASRFCADHGLKYRAQVKRCWRRRRRVGVDLRLPKEKDIRGQCVGSSSGIVPNVEQWEAMSHLDDPPGWQTRFLRPRVPEDGGPRLASPGCPGRVGQMHRGGLR
jgi:hypothetical protein